MNGVSKLAEELVSLTVEEVNRLAEVMKKEYGIEAKAPALQNCGCRLNRQQRRKAERQRRKQR